MCATRWNYISALVGTVSEKLEQLRLVLDTLLCNANEVSSAVLAPVSGYLYNLEDYQFCFCLSVFSKIFFHTTALFSYLQKFPFEAVKRAQKINATLENIYAMRDQSDEIYKTLSDDWTTRTTAKKCRSYG